MHIPLFNRWQKLNFVLAILIIFVIGMICGAMLINKAEVARLAYTLFRAQSQGVERKQFPPPLPRVPKERPSFTLEEEPNLNKYGK